MRIFVSVPWNRDMRHTSLSWYIACILTFGNPHKPIPSSNFTAAAARALNEQPLSTNLNDPRTLKHRGLCGDLALHALSWRNCPSAHS